MKYSLKIAAIGAALALLLSAGIALADDYNGSRWAPSHHYGWVPPGHGYDHKHPKYYNHKHYKKYPDWAEYKKQQYKHWKYHQRPQQPHDYYYGYRGSVPTHRKPYIPEKSTVIIEERYGFPRGYGW